MPVVQSSYVFVLAMDDRRRAKKEEKLKLVFLPQRPSTQTIYFFIGFDKGFAFQPKVCFLGFSTKIMCSQSSHDLPFEISPTLDLPLKWISGFSD